MAGARQRLVKVEGVSCCYLSGMGPKQLNGIMVSKCLGFGQEFKEISKGNHEGGIDLSPSDANMFSWNAVIKVQD